MTGRAHGVDVAPWVGEMRTATVGASIYALPASQRIRGAHAAHEAGCWIHADVILRYRRDAGFVSVGVTLEQLEAVAAALPGAAIDVHLILLGDAPEIRRDQVIDEVAEWLERLSPTRVSAAAAVLDRIGRRLRAACPDVELWGELWPAPEWAGATRLDGALVMLIEPGTKQLADPGRLGVVSRVARTLPVGVDGGISKNTAMDAVRSGASYLVLGRALFDPAPMAPEGAE
ncbi:hypothetical protein PROP_00561 [Propionicimonas sp. T2.31MG-18]|uniref:hypothetical protein n=1 Tax=Propionicimonas sp. T2.31MG-18 TaxID=3157620 RepID=UPI0035E97700